MIKRLKILLVSLITSGLIFIPALVPEVAHADSNNTNALCHGASLSVSSGSCTDTSNSINNIITWVLNIFSIIVGIAAVIMIVIGGLKYTISGGDSTRVSGAKDTILFAIVGLVVVALAQIIVHFVLNNVHSRVGG